MKYTIGNTAGGDLRTFRADADGKPSDASIRHARRQGWQGFVCSDPDIADLIQQHLDDADEAEQERL